MEITYRLATESDLPGGTRAQIDALRVKSDYRGQSVGKAVFDYAIERTRAKFN